MSAPIVSVIISTYNRAAYLPKAIDSMLAQTFRDWELILVNDGATDRTEEVVQPYLVRDRRLRYVTQANQGIASARNRALAQATGTYIAFLDDDDQWTPDKLEVQVAFMEAHSEIGMSHAALRIIRPSESPDASAQRAAGTQEGPTDFEDLLCGYGIGLSTVMVRRDLLTQVSGFNASYPFNEDYDLWLRLAQRSRLWRIGQVLAETVKDDRAALSKDVFRSRHTGIQVLRNLKFVKPDSRLERLRRHQIANLSYRLAREYYERARYWPAARYFAGALWGNPWVGLAARRPGESGFKLMTRVAKSYAAVPASVLQGMRHACR